MKYNYAVYVKDRSKIRHDWLNCVGPIKIVEISQQAKIKIFLMT